MTAILVDTSFLFALSNRRDRYHTACLNVAQTLQATLIVPVAVLPEITYLLGSRLGHHVMRQFIDQINRPGWVLEPLTAPDLTRAGEILALYADSQLDFVDATIIATAERLNLTQILTLDRRDFQIIRPAHCLSFVLLPEL